MRAMVKCSAGRKVQGFKRFKGYRRFTRFGRFTVIIRPAAVAGTWYPANPHALANEVDGYVAAAGDGPEGAIAALIVPHAGIMFSGPVAAFAYRAAARRE